MVHAAGFVALFYGFCTGMADEWGWSESPGILAVLGLIVVITTSLFMAGEARQPGNQKL
ncbi:MAG: hypothetical protein WCK86_06565 [Planctomycetia bacterium]